MQIEADFIKTRIPRDDSSKNRQFSPVEVSLPVGDVLLPLQALVEVAALGPAAPRSYLSPGNKRVVVGDGNSGNLVSNYRASAAPPGPMMTVAPLPILPILKCLRLRQAEDRVYHLAPLEA